MIDDNIFKKSGIKKTNPRVKILEYFYLHNRVTVKDILHDNLDIDQSTIYRILELFEAKNIIIKVFDHKPYYFLNKTDHKHYIECVNCHKLREIDICPYQLIDLKGFQIKQDETIKGVCETCQFKKSIGIFVGSFNPVTKAHLEIGKFLYQKKILDEIIYVPCNSPRKKHLIDIKHRFNMLKEAFDKYSYLKVDDIELTNGQANFSYQEMDLLKMKYDGYLYIILGADNFFNLEKWTNYRHLLENYQFIIVNRFEIDVLKIIKEKYSDYQNKFYIIDYESEISSTLARRKIHSSMEAEDVLDKVVINYIKKNDLYK